MRQGGRKPTRETLEQLYREQLLSLAQIGERYGVMRQMVSLWLKADGIPARSTGPRRRPRKEKAPQPLSKRPPREVLVRLYVEEGLGTAAVGKALGVDRRTVGKWMAAYGIERRRPSFWAPATKRGKRQ